MLRETIEPVTNKYLSSTGTFHLSTINHKTILVFQTVLLPLLSCLIMYLIIGYSHFILYFTFTGDSSDVFNGFIVMSMDIFFEVTKGALSSCGSTPELVSETIPR